MQHTVTERLLGTAGVKSSGAEQRLNHINKHRAIQNLKRNSRSVFYNVIVLFERV